MSAVVEARQRLDSQLQENKSVQKVQYILVPFIYIHRIIGEGGGVHLEMAWLTSPQEFSVLNEDANIYKLIGPVLVKQDRAEAVMNVDKRLEFIEAEMYVPRLTPSCLSCPTR